MVKYLRHTEIDRTRWDLCIENASFETLYPYSWYLDLVSNDWEGLVKGDYEMVMPLTRTKKFGFNFLLQPILAQQLGIFSKNQPDSSEIINFIEAIPPGFRYIDICLNKQNIDLPGKIRQHERVNHELDLKAGKAYNKNTRRNLQKAREYSFIVRGINVIQYLDLKYSAEKRVAVKRDYLQNLFEGLESMKRAQAFGVFLDNKIQSAAILGYANSRVIYMNGCSGEKGKENRSMFVLMDYLIDSSRSRYSIFDFEGSNLPGVARFFEGFGATRTSYPRIVKTKFPFIRTGK